MRRHDNMPRLVTGLLKDSVQWLLLKHGIDARPVHHEYELGMHL